MNIKLLLTNTQKVRLKLIILFALFCSASTYSQEIIVQGVITGEDNVPIPGVNILLKDSNIGVVSDFDGNYSIRSAIGKTLIFSYVGMKEQSIITKSSSLNIVLIEDVSSLEEVVVIGYGTQKKKELTGAVSQVKSDQIENVITGDISTSLQGQIAGLSVTANSGEPGEGSSILIRGVSSLTGSNNPLFVVDGVPQSGDPGLNPNEIATIDVLKDAASASIYGTRAAAGVILITTKRGKSGKTKVSLDFSEGVQSITRKTLLMNTEEQIFFDLNDQSRGTPFSPARSDRFSLLNDNEPRDLVVKNTAMIKRYNFNISGGSNNSDYSVTLGYFNQEGNVINSRLKRYNLRANLRAFKNRWTFDNTFGFTIDDRERPNFNLLLLAQRAFPYLERVDPDNIDVVDDSDERLSNINQLLGALTRTRALGRYRFEGTSNIGYKINQYLRLKTLMSAVITHQNEKQVQPPFLTFDQAGNPQQTAFDNFVFESRERRVLINWNGSLDYNRKFGKHNVTALALASVEEDNLTSIGAFVQGLSFDSPTNLSLGTIEANATSFGLLNRGVPFVAPDHRIKRIGTIGRMLYDYDGKYLFSASGRYDGTNQFSKDNRFAFFPSVSAGWNVSEENFWNKIKSTINNFKLRASIGTTGNDRIAANSYQNIVITGFDAVFQNPSDNSATLSPGIGQSRFANPNLKWEVSTQRNFGIDISFFKNKLTFTADYYNGNKNDLLINTVIPSSFGAVTIGDLFAGQRFTPRNIGDMKNSGFELSARYRPKTGNVRWNILTTFAANKNEVIRIQDNVQRSLFGNIFPVFGDGQSLFNGLQVGREAGAFLVFPTDGLLRTQDEVNVYNDAFGTSAEVGDLKYVDTDGNGQIRNEGDRIYGGSGLPDFEMGLNLSLTYKNWYFASNWFASVGNEVYNATRANALNDRRSRDLIYQFIPGVNENTDIPTFRGRSPRQNNFRPDTDFFVEDGSFIRLRNIIVSYSFPKYLTNNLGLEKFNVFANAQNVLTLTEYSGLDPEVGGNNIQLKGLDRGIIPITASYNLGLRLNF